MKKKVKENLKTPKIIKNQKQSKNSKLEKKNIYTILFYNKLKKYKKKTQKPKQLVIPFLTLKKTQKITKILKKKVPQPQKKKKKLFFK